MDLKWYYFFGMIKYICPELDRLELNLNLMNLLLGGYLKQQVSH